LHFVRRDSTRQNTVLVDQVDCSLAATKLEWVEKVAKNHCWYCQLNAEMLSVEALLENRHKGRQEMGATNFAQEIGESDSLLLLLRR
jgi:hypothetical protein